MNNTLTLILDTSQTEARVTLNNGSIKIVDGCCVVNLNDVKINQIYLSQVNPVEGTFFFIKKVYLGSLDITEIMHCGDVCRVINRTTGTEIGKFVPDIGSPDQMCITIGPGIYELMAKNAQLIRLRR